MKKIGSVVWLGFVILLSMAAGLSRAENWPQFRGPNATGVSHSQARLPAEMGPGKHLVWKTTLGKGHSSPVVFGEWIYLTALQEKRLLTLALDRKSGEIVWQRESPYEKLEMVHRIGSPATSSVVTDGTHVVSFFGSSGLACYSAQGNLLWRKRLGHFDNEFGAASSPILVEGKIVMLQDHDTGSHLAAYDVRTGKPLWRTDRSNFRRNYSTPVLWQSGKVRQIVVAGSAHVVGYDAETGKQRWVVHGLCRVVSNTPVVGGDGRLYVASSGGGSAQKQPSFEEIVQSDDVNKNGLIDKAELPNSPIKSFFYQFDRDKNGTLDEKEYESIREIFNQAQTSAMAIEPGAEGDATDSHVRWTYQRSIPRNASPLWYAGVFYMVKDGGIFTSLDAESGKVAKQGRLPGTGKYYSSPVVGDGKIYLLNERGELSVVSAEAKWQVLAKADLEEDVYATPAIADGRIYIRTTKALYCFGFAASD